MDVSRYVGTEELRFEVEFVTPAFLGGADGNAEIRTAPFKGLLRRWWRIANGHLSPEELWKREGELFGSVEKNPDIVQENKNRKPSEKLPEIFGKSKVTVKISDDSKCKVSQDKINIGRFSSDSGEIPLATYLGYGAIGVKKYIVPQSKITLQVEYPYGSKEELINAIFLIHLFGTIGARAHNGWGSVHINPKNFQFNPPLVFDKFRDWKCITKNKKNYPHIIGKDEKGVLGWKTTVCRSWEEAFSKIGSIYYQLVLDIKKDCYDLNCRKLLGFATGKERMPSHFVVKIIKTCVKRNGSLSTEYYGQIIHIPYIVDDKHWSYENQLKSSQFIHNYLDRKKLEGWQRNITGAAK